MKRRLATIGLTTVLVMGLTACNKVGELSKISLEDIEKANKGSELLDNYDSVQYQMEIHEDEGKYTEKAAIAKIDGESCYTVRLEDSEIFRTETFKDGYIYSEYGDLNGVEYSVCWCMGEEYDAYLDECVEGFLVAGTEGLEVTENRVVMDGKVTVNGKEVKDETEAEENEYISVIAQIDEGDNVSEDYDYFYEYIMDVKDLSITQFVAYMKDTEGEQAIMSFAEVFYDEEFEVPSYVKTLQKEDTRKIKIVVDPGKSSEETHEIEIAGVALFDYVLEEGYTMYSDKNGEKEFIVGSEAPGEDGMYPDMTVYAIK